MPQPRYEPIKVSPDGPDEWYLFLSEILPTAWHAAQHAIVFDGGTLVVFGLGPVGQFATRIGRHLGYLVIGIDPVPERRSSPERSSDPMERRINLSDESYPHQEAST